MTEDLQLDHVVIAVASLDEGRRWLRDSVGLTASGGVRHPSLGTENLGVPVGEGGYLELLCAYDPDRTPFARHVQKLGRDGPAFLTWAVRTSDIEETARRISSEITPMSAEEHDGRTRSWRLTGLEDVGTGFLPFFISYDSPREPRGPDAGPREWTGSPSLSSPVITRACPGGWEAPTCPFGSARVPRA